MARYYARAATKNADYGFVVCEIGEVNEGGTVYSVNVYRYDDGKMKVGIEKKYWSARESAYQYSNLGRLSPEVAGAIGPLLVEGSQKVAKFMLTGAF